MRNLFFKFCVTTVIGCFLFPPISFAGVTEVPATIHYQAHLTNASGLNFDGNVNAEIWIYDSQTEGADRDIISEHLLYAESHEDINVDRGMLRLSIGEGKTLGRFSGTSLPLEMLAQAQDLFIQLYLNGEKVEPRQYVGYQNYALKAEYAKVAENLSGTLSIPSSSLPHDMDASMINEDKQLQPGRIPTMDASMITGSVNANQIPVRLPLDIFADGSLINDAVIGHIDSSGITTGTFSDGVIPSSVMRSDSVFFQAGDASDNQLVEIPREFWWLTNPRAHCGIIVGIKSFELPVDTYADELKAYADEVDAMGVPLPYYRVHCGVRYITSMYPCDARYLMACVRYPN